MLMPRLTNQIQNSFHTTAIAVYQRKASAVDRSECIKPTQNVPAISLKDVPTTIVPRIQSSVTGNPKPSTSPCYPLFMTGRNEDD